MTKGGGCDIITELSERDGLRNEDEDYEWNLVGNRSKKPRKKLQKSLKNLLTKASECDVINKPSERDRQDQQKRDQESRLRLCEITKAH